MSHTPQSDSNTTTADTPPSDCVFKTAEGSAAGVTSSYSGRMTAMKPSGKMLVQQQFPQYEKAQVLLIAVKGLPKTNERMAIQMLASCNEEKGEYLIISGLGDAVTHCFWLMKMLEERQMAICERIATKCRVSSMGTPKRPSEKTSEGCNDHNSDPNPTHPSPFPTGSASPGIEIVMKKHPSFKGTCIAPEYMIFDELQDGSESTHGAVSENNNKVGGYPPLYPKDPPKRHAAVNAGDINLYVGGGGINRAFGDVLTAAGQDISLYKPMHERLLEDALKANEGYTNEGSVCAQYMHNPPENPDVRFVMCRPCMSLVSTVSKECGAVFLSVFKNKFPEGRDRNMAMVYVVGPKGTLFKNKQDFLDAVKATGANMMQTICFYNDLIRLRRSPKDRKIMTEPTPLRAINMARMCLVSGGVYKHADATVEEVARSLMKGLDDGFKSLRGPKLCFPPNDPVFKQVWEKDTGHAANSVESK